MMKKTVLFFGAGSTASLKYPTTEQQAPIFRERLLKAESGGEYELASKYFRSFFGEDLKSLTVMQLYNLLDEHIRSEGKFGEYSYLEAIEVRRNVISMVQEIFLEATKNALDNSLLDEYSEFFKKMAEISLREKRALLPVADLQSERFIFSDFSYVSLNWDVIFLWCMFQAHKELNDQNRRWQNYCGKNVKLKIFNDFGIYLATKPLEQHRKDKKWFPYNETVATRLNDPDHLSDRIVTLIKTFFPHGQTNWLECPKCRNVSMYLGDTWDKKSESIGMKGEYSCLHCGERLQTSDAAILLQTLIKKKASYITEIQRNMLLEFEKAERMVFVGYSLPEDDFEYRTMFLSKNNKEREVYVVLYAQESKDEWKTYASLSDAEKKDGAATRFYELFGKNVRFNFGGFPNVAESVVRLMDGT